MDQALQPLDFVLEVLDPLVLLLAHRAQQLQLLVRLGELSLQLMHPVFGVLQLNHLRIDVLHVSISDLTSPRSIVQSRDVLLNESVGRRQTGDHDCVRVTAE